MRTINTRKEIFFMSLGWAGVWNNPESIMGGIVRAAANHILHLPLVKIECNSKQEFVSKVSQMAESMWDKAKGQRKLLNP